MTTLDGEPSPAARIPIDTRFLLGQFPSLIQIRRGHRTWDEYGQKLASEMEVPVPTVRVAAAEPGSRADSKWVDAKRLIYEILATGKTEHQPNRKRLGDLQTISTPILLSTLGLWLAGMLGISVSVTKPMVAVILFAVAEAGDNWDILIDG